ncbi:MAG: hypothetical protein V3V08_00145, partial [Nannocystaceae bacterium]
MALESESAFRRGDCLLIFRGQYGFRPCAGGAICELTEDLRRRVANPRRYRDEEYLYHEDATAGSVEADKALGVRTYTVTRTKNIDRRVHRPSIAARPRPTKRFSDLLQAEDKSARTTVAIGLRGIPEWDIPTLPELGTVPTDEATLLLAERDARIVARKARVANRANGVTSAIKNGDGHILHVGWSTGVVFAEVPAQQLLMLMSREDLRSLDLVDMDSVEDSTVQQASGTHAAPASSTRRAATDWTLG